ncbi:nucleotide-binding universal stress UspA family protein [Branchiibius hedensis]|uniref:Nucleotide-binding universal stress protein, UspA family n=1 Tax=Branchiibius hedensis TaxID=672460 RepID=A0A2Y9BTN1_9MICO|nr:universal stress protein [Branchiibius hedensis]PWJ25469.1 nucleotide-binding universal stress UspA family protein [Branchiibius hedensis]SSA34282.1 Nucleotide-binding universal stress protein, UspA family [Branchiibius hedensis]
MSIVVGFGPHPSTNSGLYLAAQLARTTGDELVLCCIIQSLAESPAMRDPAGIDSEWQHRIQEAAAEALAAARDRLPADLPVTEVVRSGRSVPAILQREGDARRARVLVVGSSTSGPLGQISLGSTSDRLVHSSSLPVGLAPRGYRPGEDTVKRVVLAVRPGHSDLALSDEAAALCNWLAVPATLVTFAVRDSAALTVFADQGVFDSWRADAVAAQQRISDELEQSGVTISRVGVLVGSRWSRTTEQFDWSPGDLLVLGSSEHAPLARVFLGSTATRIVRTSPVPTVLLPRRRRA